MEPALQGIRIADFTGVLAGPSATTLLADLGADVIKVEDVDRGDSTRQVLPYVFQAVNRNKRSLAVDLRTDAGSEVCRRLVGTADVMVQAYRPGALAARGLGGPELLRRHPRLIYASLTGFGSTGPGAGKRGIDQLIQAETGMANVMGGVIGRLGFVDLAAGIALSQAVLAALYRRERTGQGEEVEVTLYDTSLWLQCVPVAEYSATRQPPLQPEGYGLRTPTLGAFDVRGGRVFISILEQRDWQAFCALLGRPEWIEDPRFVDRAAQREHGSIVKAMLTLAMAEQDLDVLLEAAGREGLMVSRIKDYEDVFGDPQASANGSFETVESWDGQQIVQVRGPVRHLADGPAPYRRPPRLGEDTAEVLTELGYGAAEIAALVGDRVVRSP